MAKIRSYDDIINRIGGGFCGWQPFYDIFKTNSIPFGTNNHTFVRCGSTADTPSAALPTGEGVSAYMVTSVNIEQTDINFSYNVLVGKLISFGSFNNATNTFTDGSAMPTVTELNQSRALCSPILVEVTTATNSAPGNLTITYVDQDGNSAEAGSAQAMGASAPIRSSGWYALNSTDTGARDITAVSRSSGSSHAGVLTLWGVIPIALMSHQAVRSMSTADNLITSGFNPVRLLNGDTIGVFMGMQSSVRSMAGSIFLVGDS